MQPVDTSHDSLLQIQVSWHFIPYVGYGHLDAQFIPIYPGTQSILSNKKNIYTIKLKMSKEIRFQNFFK